MCAGVGLGMLAVYAATLAPGVLGGDAGELQFVPPILGLPHPTGYPLQVLLHKSWSLVPIGTVAYRLNLLDAIVAATAVVLIVACARELGGLAPAVLAGLTFGLGELWWSQAVTGDKYTLNGLFLAATLLLYLRWRQRPSERLLRALALTYGLSLTHHRSMLLVAPALAVGLLLDGWRPRSWRSFAILAGLVLAPLSLYLYVPWAASRGLPPGSWPVATAGQFAEFLLDRGYTSQVRPDAALAGRLVEEGRVLVRSFGPLGAALGLFGLAWLFRRDWRLATMLLTAFVPQAVFGASYLLESHYALPRHWVFFLPAFLIWALWVASGLELVLGLLRHMATRLGRTDEARFPRRYVVAGLAVLLLASQAGSVWLPVAEARVRAQLGAEALDGYRQDLQRSGVAERFGRLAFQLAAPSATIVCDWEQATVLWYFQRVEGLRPDVSIRYPIETLDDALAAARREGRPLYVARTLPGLEALAVPSSAGPLIQVWPARSPAVPAGVAAADARFEDGLSLVGVDDHTTARRPGGVVSITLFWRAERPLAADYAVSVRLVGPAGGVLAQHDERHPALGASPTSRWRPGDVVGDYHELPLGNRLTPGRYRVDVVAYRPDPLHKLRRLGPGGQLQDGPIQLDSFELEAQSAGPLDLLFRRR